MSSTSAVRARALAVAVDLVCVLAFALGGRDAHEPGAGAGILLVIAWPFAVGALVGHAVAARAGWDAVRWRPAGLTVLAAAYLLGLALRAASGRGLAHGFLVVAAVFLALTLLGWRLAHTFWTARRRRSPAA